MQLNYKQSQFELFPGAVNGSNKTPRPQFFFSSITLSLENLVISGIVALMAVIFSFSAGVEKGKKARFDRGEDAANFPAVAVVERKHVPSGPLAQKKSVVPLASSQSVSSALDSSVTGALAAASVAASDPENQPPAAQLQEDLSGAYTVQVASFKKDEHAQKEALMLKKKGYDIIVLPKGSYSIVCVGKFSRREQASVFLSRLKKTYKDCMIRRL